MEASISETDIAMLLPFWVNGSLAPDEAAEVAVAVAANPGLQAEAEFLRSLHNRMQTEDAGYSPGEIGLARLKRSIATQAVPLPKRRDLSLRFATAAAVVAAIVGFGASEAFRPVTVEYVQASGGDSDAAMTVGFADTATAKMISDYLLAEGVIILDGPSAVGRYRLAPIDAAVVDVAALAERMQARPDLFVAVDWPE